MELPKAFISRTKAMMGGEWDGFVQALNETPPVSIRLNPCKISPSYCTEQAVDWASNAFYLETRPSFTMDPLFHSGSYYVQEASSMYLEQIIKNQVREAVKCLDLCAAPGGKSTQLISVLPQDSLLVANEVIRSRANILAENLIKWGNSAAIVTTDDPRAVGQLLDFFDVMVADVPCSGEGMFRKDKVAIDEWSPENVRMCAERQRRIIADAWPALKPNGLLVYSTCTFNTEENEENIEWIMKELGACIVEAPRRFMFHQSKGEGFFIVALRKDGDNTLSFNADHCRKSMINLKSGNFKISDEIASFVMHPDDFSFSTGKEITRAIPKIHEAAYHTVNHSLRVIHAGIMLGERKGKDFIPAHCLAMSTALRKDSFHCLELGKEAALHYLRKEALSQLPENIPKGYALITYQGQVLGLVKNIGNRANNLYPHEWRIRKEIACLI